MNVCHAVLAVLLMLALPAVGQDVRQIKVSVKCRAADGGAKSDAPVACRTLAGSWSALTDAEGHATLTVGVRADERTLRVRLGPKDVLEGEEGDFNGYVKAAAIKRSNFVPDQWLVKLLPGVSEYSLNMDLGLVRQMTFHFVDQDGVGKDCVVLGPGAVREQRPVVNGVVQVLGVPTDSSELVVLCGQQLIELSVPPGEKDVDLGNVVLPSRVFDASVTIRLVNVKQIDHRGNEMAELPVLVSADGKSLYALWSHKDVTTAGPGLTVPAKVPSGEYWVSPFPWTSSGTTQALIRLVRAGVDLSGLGIPKITAVAGSQVDLEIDAAAAQSAILHAAAAHGVWPEY